MDVGCLTVHSQPGRWIQQQMQAGASAASESPQAHTQFVLASLLYSASNGSSLGDVGSSLSLHTRVRTLAPRPGETGMDWLLPVAGQLGPTRS